MPEILWMFGMPMFFGSYDMVILPLSTTFSSAVSYIYCLLTFEFGEIFYLFNFIWRTTIQFVYNMMTFV